MRPDTHIVFFVFCLCFLAPQELCNNGDIISHWLKSLVNHVAVQVHYIINMLGEDHAGILALLDASQSTKMKFKPKESHFYWSQMSFLDALQVALVKDFAIFMCMHVCAGSCVHACVCVCVFWTWQVENTAAVHWLPVKMSAGISLSFSHSLSLSPPFLPLSVTLENFGRHLCELFVVSTVHLVPASYIRMNVSVCCTSAVWLFV